MGRMKICIVLAWQRPQDSTHLAISLSEEKRGYQLAFCHLLLVCPWFNTVRRNFLGLLFCREGYFTTLAANKGRQEWLNCLVKSLAKYNLYCQATEAKIQEYLSGKYAHFLEESDQNEFPVKVAVQSLGLQQIPPEAEELGVAEENVWVLNKSTQVCIASILPRAHQ